MLHYDTNKRPDFINLFEGYNFNKFMLKNIKQNINESVLEKGNLNEKLSN